MYNATSTLREQNTLQSGTDNTGVLRVLSLIGALGIFVGISIRIGVGDDFVYSIWTDRDLWRGINLLNEFQVTGSEMGGTEALRTPGGFQSYIYYLLYKTVGTPIAMWWLVNIGFFGAILFLGLTIRKYANFPIAILTAALILTSYTTHEEMLQLWNPSFAVIFVLLAYTYLLKIVFERCSHFLLQITFFTGIAAQYHLSSLLMITLAAFFIAVFRIPIKIRTVIFSILIIVLLYSPFIWHEVLNDFPWISEAIRWRTVTSNSEISWSSISLQAREYLSVVGNFYRPPFIPIFGDVPKAGLALAGFFALVLLANTLVVCIAIHIIRFLKQSIDKKFENIKTNTIDTLTLINLIIALLVAVGFLLVAADFSRRRLIPLIPVGAVLGSLALYSVAGVVQQIAIKKIRSISVGTLIVLILFTLFFPLWHWIELHPHWPRFGGLRDLVQEYGHATGRGAEHFRNRVALLTSYPEPRFVPSSQVQAGQFAVEALQKIYWRDNVFQADGHETVCTAVLANRVRLESGLDRLDGGLYPIDLDPLDEFELKKRIRLTTKSALSTLGQKVQLGRVFLGSTYSFVDYKSEHENCLKTFVNPFILTDIESQVAQYRRPLIRSSDVQEVIKFHAPGTIGAYAFDLSNVFGPWALLLHKSERGVYFSLHGRGSRGYQGYGSSYLTKPTVILVPLDEANKKLKLETKFLDVGNGVSLTPWRSKELYVQPGNYSLMLKVDRLKSRTLDIGSLFINLDDKITILAN